MNLDYIDDLDNELILKDIIIKLGLDYINPNQIKCVKSYKSESKRILARLHSSHKIFTHAFNSIPLYIIELVSENFDKLDEKEKLKVLIHELLHIPMTFSGGSRHHGNLGSISDNGKMSRFLNVNCKTIDKLFNEYCEKADRVFKEEGLLEKFAKRLLR